MSDYSIWVLEYAYMLEVPKGMVLHGAYNEGFVRMPFCYVLLKGHGRTALIDVGYSYKNHGQDLACTFNILNWRPPKVVLGSCGVAPEDVSHVFFTHAHFDHMGSTDDFPNAKFYLQERELAKWIWAMSLDRRFRWMLGATDPVDIIRAVDLARQGRLVSIDGDVQDVLPNIDLHAAFDSHTWGSMYVNIRNDGARNSADNWVFAGDLLYSYSNMTGLDPKDPQYLPTDLTVGSQTTMILFTDEMIKRVGGEIKRVIPIHDNALKDVFPSRVTDEGLAITEIALAKGEKSLVH
jgi:glyoxylase-like metal-dependent hydrolase (beta-lactamase superfamily II)